MKAVVVVALIALCACAFELPKKPTFGKLDVPNMKAIRDDPSSDPEWFEPKDLPCAFSVDYKLFEGDTEDMKGTIYIGGNHSCMSYKMEVAGIEVKYKEIIRADITKDGDVCYVETTSGKYQGEEVYICEGCTWVDPEYTTTYAFIIRERLLSSWPYDTKEEKYGWTDDITCTRYQCKEKCYPYVYDFCVDDKGRLAGFDNGSYKWAFDEYDDDASKDDFSVKSKYEGCDDAVYEETKPVPESCELKDAASAVKAVAAVVLAMMALFF